MKPLLQFERKVGWPEIISLFALLVSAGALWYSRAQVVQNLPDLQLDSQPALRISSSSTQEELVLTAVLPFVITNRGGRTATLVKLERDTLPAILQMVDGKVTVKHDLLADFALVDNKANSNAQLSEVLASAEIRPLALPQIVNEPIDSGKSRTFALLLKVKSNTGRSMSDAKVFFSCRAVFSDGTTIRIAQAFGLN